MASVVRADLLRFTGGKIGRIDVGWTGEWPPPVIMGVARGKETGLTKVFDPGEQTRALLIQIARCETIDFAIYRRISYSQKSASQNGKVRGAMYRQVVNRSVNAIGPFA